MNRILQLRSRLQATGYGKAALRILSWGYGAGVFLHRSLYQLKILRSRRLPAKTVCIGNLTVGGTGKTSAVLLAARTLRRSEVNVAVLSRGYRRPEPTRDVQVLGGSRSAHWMKAGDEPWMMYEMLRDLKVPVLISPNRYRAGMEALEQFNARVLLLDDGYQHLKLKRDLDIVLVSAANPFGGGHLLPLGDLREPLRGLRRAGMILITHTDRVEPDRLAELKDRLRSIHPKAPILEAAHRPDFLMDLRTEQRLPLKHLKGTPVGSFCAIGDPASFQSHLKALGAEPNQAWRFPDHHVYTIEELRSIENIRVGMPLVTTLKDVPRLPLLWPEILSGEVLALSIRLEITRGRELWDSELLRLGHAP